MNVLYVAGINPGGSADALVDLIKEIKKNKDKDITPIVLLGASEFLSEKLENLNVKFYRLNYVERMRDRAKGFMRVAEIILFPLIKLRYYYGIYSSLKKIDNMLDMDKIDIIHNNDDRIDLGLFLAKKYNKKNVFHIREHMTGHFDMMFKRKNYIREINKYADRVLCVSDSVKKDWINSGLDKEKAQTVHNSIDISLFSKKKNVLNDVIVKIVFVGYISKEKGQLDAVKVLAKLPESYKNKYKIDMFGSADAEYLNKIVKCAKDNGIAFEYKGQSNNIRKELVNYDIGLNCSFREGFSRAVEEYMATGLLTVVNDKGGNPETVQNMETGLVFKNEDELVDFLIDAIDNKEKYQIIAQNGGEKALRFGVDVELNSIVDVYGEVFGK